MSVVARAPEAMTAMSPSCSRWVMGKSYTLVSMVESNVPFPISTNLKRLSRSFWCTPRQDDGSRGLLFANAPTISRAKGRKPQS